MYRAHAQVQGSPRSWIAAVVNRRHVIVPRIFVFNVNEEFIMAHGFFLRKYPTLFVYYVKFSVCFYLLTFLREFCFQFLFFREPGGLRCLLMHEGAKLTNGNY